MKKFLINLLVLIIIISPVIALAVGKDIGLQNPIGVSSISELILIVVRVVRYILIPFVVIAIMYSGWCYLVGAQGWFGYTLSYAHKVIKSTLIGAFIILSAELIAQVIGNTIKTLTN